MPNLSRVGWGVTVDSVDGPSNPGTNMLDGNDATAWVSGSGYPHYVILDLGTAQTFDSIINRRKDYDAAHTPTTVEVYVSDDGIAWGSVIVTATWPKSGATEVIMLPRQTKRYVKLLGVSSLTSVQWAISELNLWIEQGLNRYAWSATATSYYDADTDPSKAIDGYDLENYSNWISDSGMPQSITIDMGSLQTINYIRVQESNSRFYVPIFWGQPLPNRVNAYVSVDNITWTMVREMVWPGYGGTHWTTFYDVDGITLKNYTVRYFRFEATLVGGTYDRLAISEIYAGQLAVGEQYKYYHKAHPQSFNIHQESKGEIDYFSLVPDSIYPANLQLGKVEGKIRLWRTTPLALDYPQVAMSLWNLPTDWGTIVLESVSIVAEGQHLDSPEIVTVSEFNLKPTPFSWGTGGDDWFYGTGDIAPQVAYLVYTVASGWPAGWTQATLPNIFSNMTIWNSVNQTALSHDDADVSRLLIDDHYLYVVWELPYVPPVYPTDAVNLTALLTFSGQLLVSRYGGTGPGPGGCPDIVPGIIPPTLAPIPLECFHLVVANPEDGIYVQFDFTGWLAAGDALLTATWTADAGVVIDGQSATSTAASLTANIPAAVDGEQYFLKCTVITQMGTTEVRRVQVEVRDADFGTLPASAWWRV